MAAVTVASHDRAVAKAVARSAKTGVVMNDTERMKLVSTEQSLAMETEPRIPASMSGLENFKLGTGPLRKEDRVSREDAKADAESFFNLAVALARLRARYLEVGLRIATTADGDVPALLGEVDRRTAAGVQRRVEGGQCPRPRQLTGHLDSRPCRRRHAPARNQLQRSAFPPMHDESGGRPK